MRTFGEDDSELSGADINAAMRRHLPRRQPDLLGAAALLLGLATAIAVLAWVVT